MGYYYALALGEEEIVATAIKEQYLPTGEESALPSTLVSALVAMGSKLDTLIGMFSIGEIPTGSRDPFALRRAVNGLIKIAINHSIPLNFSGLIDQLSSLYPATKEYKSAIESFIIDRLSGVYPAVNPSIISSVVGKTPSIELSVLELDAKIRAVDTIASSEGFSDAFSTFQRVSNILKDVSMEREFNVDPSLFDNPYETQLYTVSTAIINKEYSSLEERLDALFGLKNQLDLFFENVMVNAENSQVKANRQSLIGMIYAEIYAIADIKNITL